jgi:hypothetical protein
MAEQNIHCVRDKMTNYVRSVPCEVMDILV